MNSSYSADETLKAWRFLEGLASNFSNASIRGMSSVFVIGSLPGGYFRPSQSDLDLVVLFKDPPVTGENLESLTKQLVSLATSGQEECTYEIELLPRFNSELGRNPENGLLQNPDLIARLKVQSRQLFGDYPVQSLPMPSSAEWAWEANRVMRVWSENAKTDPSKYQTLDIQIKKTLTLVRLYLAVRRDVVEYNKFKLLEAYAKTVPAINIGMAVQTAVQDHLNGKEVHPLASANLLGELAEVQDALIEAIL